MEDNTLQNNMFRELRDKTIFDMARDFAFDYLDQIGDRNVFPTDEALARLENFEEDLPWHSTPAENVMQQLHQSGAPNAVATLGGRYFGFVCGSVLPIGLAAKTLGTYWDQSPSMYVLSPIGSKLESVTERWLVDLFGLPAGSCAGFVSGTSMANLCALAAARYRILQKKNWDIGIKGLYDAPKIRIITGRHAHSTVLKAIGILGLGRENIEWAEVDAQGRILPESVPVPDENTILILQAGNVNSGSFDDFKEICAKAKQAGAWIHIDGAFGLWAAASEKLSHLTKGIGMADSWAVDGHKTLNTPYDCGIVLCADREALTAALHMSGSYIVESRERDGMFYTPEMSRRARIIELWATLKYLGREGISQLVLSMHHRAKEFADLIGEIKGYKVENEVVFNQVLVSCENDQLTENVLRKVQELRACWCGGSVWFGKKVIRVSVCSWATTSQDIRISVQSFEHALESEREKI